MTHFVGILPHVFAISALSLISCTQDEGQDVSEEGFFVSPDEIKHAKYSPEGEWGYTWPHGIMPLQFSDLEFVSGPIDLSLPNSGRVAQNWNTPLVFRSFLNNISVKIWAAKDFQRSIITSIGPDDWGDWENRLFREINDIKFDISYTFAESIEFNEPPETYTYYFLIRDASNLFRVEITGSDFATMKKLAKSIRHEIVSWRSNNLLTGS